MREPERCSLCDRPIRNGAHEVCRKCVQAQNWAEAQFGYFPERRRAQ